VGVGALHVVALGMRLEQGRPPRLAAQRVGRHDQLAAGGQHPGDLAERLRPVVEVLDGADRQHPVERPVGERQLQRVAEDLSGRVGQLSAAHQLVPGDVDVHRVRAAPAGLPGPVTVSPGHVQDPQATQVRAEPAQQGAGLPITTYMHLVAGEGDRVRNVHGGQTRA